jgi:hypothetical protein
VINEGWPMARLNPGYGSELHLLRMLGRHRDFFDRRVLQATGAEAVEWRDFPSGAMRRDSNGVITWDQEWHHLEFLPISDPARIAWERAWPTHRPGHRWDAIGRLRYGDYSWEWLLLEAKANIEEISSSCGAQDSNSLTLIRGTIEKTKAALGVSANCDWLNRYYQYCNRLAALNVMNNAGTSARLLYVYFFGDENVGRTCPASPTEWSDVLSMQDAHVGLPVGHYLEQRVHKLFLNSSVERS